MAERLESSRVRREAAEARTAELEAALGVVIDEIEGGDLQYAVAFAKHALGGK